MSTQSQNPSISEELEALLRALIVRHESLLELTLKHHEAIRQADTSRCEAVSAQARTVLAEIAELEASRQGLIKRAQAQLPRQSSVARLSDIARCLPDPVRTALLELAEKLRALIQRVQEEQSLLRVVSRVLVANMNGLVRQVAQSLSHAGIYAKSGTVSAGAAVASSLDIRH